VHIWDYSRMNFVYTLLSKRKLQWFVDNGHVTGWDDPRFPTVRGIRRRGMTIEALRQYILMQGASQNQLMLEWDKLWALNKKVIDPVSPRHVTLDKLQLVAANLVGGPSEAEVRAMPKHKKNPELGEKQTVFGSGVYIDQADAVTFEEGEEITLMDWGNAFVESLTRDAQTGAITDLQLRLHLDGNHKLTKKKVTWLSPSQTRPLVPVTLHDYDYLINKKKLEEDDVVTDHLTAVTEFSVETLGDHNLATLKSGDIIQLERRGYYIVDRAYNAEQSECPMQLIAIPDGKATSTSSKAAATTITVVAPVVEKPAKSSSPSDAVGATLPNRVGDMYAATSVYGDCPLPTAEETSDMFAVKSIY